jgi:hypothetical protein
MSIDEKLGAECFHLLVGQSGNMEIHGGDASGLLYGCIELEARIKASGGLPAAVDFTDKPAMKLRGPCIGMQKTFLLPGRKVYEYPYTPELFPWFYDKSYWKEYLDFLVENRMNTLYLWNGHPFASLVKVKEYPFAMEVSEETFRKNVEMFKYVTEECDRRGIWLVQMFYSIILPKPFADHYKIATQLAAPTPESSDYTRKAIAEFVHQYPNVGLMVCLGEALQGLDNQIYWCTNVVLGGVKDGMKLAGLTTEPPVVVRTHATDARVIMPEALKVYKNLYTEAKFNGESLTTWEPRGTRQELQQTMSALGSTHIANIHILANLEPFRYGAQRFIKKCVQAARERLGAKAIHLYPLCYWNWPDSPDIATVPLKQYDRDWMWFDAWARYSWNPYIDEKEDHQWWIGKLTEKYGDKEAAEKILAAMNDSGECAPRLLRRFGITEGNRQTLSLGMTLDQLVNPDDHQPFPELWESQSPPGERLQEFAEKDWKKQPHSGETPPQIMLEVLDFSAKAVGEIDAAMVLAKTNLEELQRVNNDIHCIRLMSENYAAKAQAALLVLRYRNSGNIADMELASQKLGQSLDAYKELADLTYSSYRFANGMQTAQRKIPLPGGAKGKPANFHWKQLVPFYQRELAEFQAKVERLKKFGNEPANNDESSVKPLPAAQITILSTNAETYTVEKGARVFTDRQFFIRDIAPELVGLTGIRFSHNDAKKGRYSPIEFQVNVPVQILVGYVAGPSTEWLTVPRLEVAAQADDRGGLAPVIKNCVTIDAVPSVELHSFSFGAGRQKLDLIGQGSFVVLGIVPQSVTIGHRDARRRAGD